jgi:hypothetical protein
MVRGPAAATGGLQRDAQLLHALPRSDELSSLSGQPRPPEISGSGAIE